MWPLHIKLPLLRIFTMRLKNVTTKVLLATVSVALSLSLCLMLVMSYFMNSLTDTVMLGMLRPMAKTAAQNVENQLYTLAERFFLLRESPVIRSLSGTAREKQVTLDIVSVGREYAWLGIYELDGSLLTGSDACPRNIMGRELFPLMQKTANLVIEKTTIGTSGPEIVMGLPIMSGYGPKADTEGAAVYYLVGGYRYDVLSDVLRDINIGASGTAFIIDQNGYIIAHKDLGRIFSQEPVRRNLGSGPEAENVFVAMVDRQPGSARLRTPGNDIFVGYSPIKGTMWALGIQAPRGDFMMAARQALLTGTVLTVAVLLAAIFLVGLLNRKVLSLPLAAITASARQLAGGNFGSGLPASITDRKDEIGQLGAAFARMSDSIHRVIRDLRDLTVANSAGDLAARARPEAFSGDFQRIVAGMNTSLDGICSYLDSMPDAFLLLNRRREHMYHNTAMEKILLRHGLRAEDPALFTALVPVESGGPDPETEGLFSKKTRTEEQYEREVTLSGANGQEYIYAVSLGRVESPAETVCVMLILNDVTLLARARAQAEAASRAKGDFLARMSHEMRTPMNAIIGMASIGLSAEDSERKQYCLSKIAGASQHLLGVINDILDMAKIEADKFELSPSAFNLTSMLQRVVDVIRFQTEEKKQRFSVDIDGRFPPAVFADEQRMAQVVTNLLSNAVKFTPESGCVALRAELASENADVCAVRISVSDNGIGMSEEQRCKLFRPFEQADGSISRKFGGTGLGLAISKRIVEQMGGTISVRSIVGEGSEFTFEVTVPKALGGQEPQGSEPAGEGDPGEKDVDDRDIFRGRRVLLAEDVEINREIISSLLEHTGLEMVFACDGAEAVESFLADPRGYDLILMDVQMPQVDGYEATRRIRASGAPGAESIPIIAMTANVFREDIDRCLVSGMNGHLGKPVDPDEVIAMLVRQFKAAGKIWN